MRKLIAGKNGKPEICGRNFWKNRLSQDVTEKFKIAHQSTKESRLRLLHFKICHNIFPSNILLYKMGIRNSDLCEHCGVKDYIEHMFVHCTLLKDYWKLIFDLIYQKCRTRFPATEGNILFGFGTEVYAESKKCRDVANHILLIAKMCISKMRYRSESYTKNVFLVFENDWAIREKRVLQKLQENQ